MLERDPDLLERLESYVHEPFEGIVYRVVWADGSPVQGSSVARGCWNSPDSEFEALNTSGPERHSHSMSSGLSLRSSVFTSTAPQ